MKNGYLFTGSCFFIGDIEMKETYSSLMMRQLDRTF